MDDSDLTLTRRRLGGATTAVELWKALRRRVVTVVERSSERSALTRADRVVVTGIPRRVPASQPKAHAVIRVNSSRQNGPPCSPARSYTTTSAPAPRSAFAHSVAFARKNGSSVPATK
jgi:hypothetical protein